MVVGPDREIRATGYNGFPPGVDDRPPERHERPEKYLWSAHAEQNAISFAALNGVSLKGCTLYCTHHPCSRCAQMIIRAGITRVVFGTGTTNMSSSEFYAASRMFMEAGVETSRA